MPEDKTLHVIAATIFGLVAIVHAIRLGTGTNVTIGSWQAPMWVSWLALFILGSLAVLIWQKR